MHFSLQGGEWSRLDLELELNCGYCVYCRELLLLLFLLDLVDGDLGAVGRGERSHLWVGSLLEL